MNDAVKLVMSCRSLVRVGPKHRAGSTLANDCASTRGVRRLDTPIDVDINIDVILCGITGPWHYAEEAGSMAAAYFLLAMKKAKNATSPTM